MSITVKLGRIICVLYDGIQMLDVVGPADVFSQAAALNNKSCNIVYAASQANIRANNGLNMVAEALPRDITKHDTILVPGGDSSGIEVVLADNAFMEWMPYAVKNAGLIASVCTGAFILNGAGVLRGRRVATHWSCTEKLEAQSKGAIVDAKAIFIQDGKIWSSAGVTAGIDMALAIVNEIYGKSTRIEVAKELVLHMTRSGNQSQYSNLVDLQAKSGPTLSPLIPWLEQQLSSPITVDDMAGLVGLSERQFHRRCVSSFGKTPAHLLLMLRLDRACELLQNSENRMDQIASLCGFSNASIFSKAFKREYGLTPKHYQMTWGS
ncbi:MAG: DJ-1/PfpI family protein [Hellea sp.]